MPSPVVIDTNVLVAANGRDTHASDLCQKTSRRMLDDARNSGPVLIDDSQQIYKEYRSYCSYRGEPGAGDFFFKWLHENQDTPERCRKVRITVDPHDANTIAEFPKDPDLRRFDPSDRKFVAVVVVSGEDAPVLEATDRRWWKYRAALLRNGVRVEFICPDELNKVRRKAKKRR
jgi:hypothetical protein